MKVLFDCHMPFLLAHGGAEILIMKMMEGLKEAGVEAEPLRWWDAGQKGDIIQFIGRGPTSQIQFAHGKGIKFAMFELLTAQGSRSKTRLGVQGFVTKFLRNVMPAKYRNSFGWDSYRTADAFFTSTAWEAEVMQILYGAPKDLIHVIPNGVDGAFFQSDVERADRVPRLQAAEWMVCLATISERKRIHELCEAAIIAKTPLWVIGKPYAKDTYFEKFEAIVEKSKGYIRFVGAITQPAELAPILKAARGFVLLSTSETQSTAASAAAAAGCPLLLADLPWARSSFGDRSSYCPLASAEKTAFHLRSFYDSSPLLPEPPRQPAWSEVAEILIAVYKEILKY